MIATKVYSRVGRGAMISGLLAATLWTVWRSVSDVCRPTISTSTRSMPTIPWKTYCAALRPDLLD